MSDSVVVKKIKDLQDVVYRCLRSIPEARDNNKLLTLKIWCYQNPEFRDESYSANQFGIDFLNGRYADPQSIARASRKVQRMHPEVRGEKWAERQGESVKVREQIND